MSGKKQDVKKDRTPFQLSLKPIAFQNTIFCMLLLFAMCIGMLCVAMSRMQNLTETAAISAGERIEHRLRESQNLLEALVKQPQFADASIDPIEKAHMLNEIKEIYGYYFLNYVDEDIVLHPEELEPFSLAYRDYMQRVYATGASEITDCFPNSMDDVTLNYLIVVPIKDEEQQVKGALCTSIYFDEITRILEDAAEQANVEFLLAGSEGQMMTSTVGVEYGQDMNEIFQAALILGTNAASIQEQFITGEKGVFWDFHKGSLYITRYSRIPNSKWTLIASVNLWMIILELFPGIVIMTLLCIAVTIIRVHIERRELNKHFKTIDMLLTSVGELERMLHREEHPDAEHYDFNEIIQLTSKGLTDGLTGTVTRTVFCRQAKEALAVAERDKLHALCFIDLDNLKYINDTFGHQGGDLALRKIGYILKEFEKRYDGIAGRYGGDEFVMLFPNLESREELTDILDELILRMHMEASVEEGQIPIRCSMGISLHCEGKSLEQLISEADEALYFVKHNGKGYYNVYAERNAHEKREDT